MPARTAKAVSNEAEAEKAKMVRLTVRLTDICGSGHYGSAFSMAEIVATLITNSCMSDPMSRTGPIAIASRWARGTLIGMSRILADLGFFPRADLDSYTRLGSPLGDHPDMRKVKGADFSSGSIGRDLSVSVGMALGLRLKRSPARVVCLMGDGKWAKANLGSGHGGRALSARQFGRGGRHQQSRFRRRNRQSDGQPAAARQMAALQLALIVLSDGHDLDAVRRALHDALNGAPDKPCVVLADTIAGKGVSFMEHTWQWHLGFLGPADRERAYAEIEKGLAP